MITMYAQFQELLALVQLNIATRNAIAIVTLSRKPMEVDSVLFGETVVMEIHLLIVMTVLNI